MSGFVGCDIHESYLHGCTLCKHNWRGTEAAVEKARADAAEAEVEMLRALPEAELRRTAETQRDALIKALREYGQHKPNCDPEVNVCDCGLAAAIKEAGE